MRVVGKESEEDGWFENVFELVSRLCNCKCSECVRVVYEILKLIRLRM